MFTGNENFNKDEINQVHAVILCDVDDQKILYAKNAKKQIQPTTITMLATALTILEYMDLSTQVTVTDKALVGLGDAPVIGLKEGDCLTVEQLLAGMMYRSGFDCANALAIACSSSINKFVKLMNKTVQSIGCVDTKFTSPGGSTDPNQYTTVYDVYLIMNRLQTYEPFMDLISKKSYKISYQVKNGPVVEEEYTSSIPYVLGEYTLPKNLTLIGGKAGTTYLAGSCTALYLKDTKGKGYIAIGMKSQDKVTLYGQMEILFKKIQ
ncbi:D-alanyl-D-alanine carboxypeptidase [Lachnospiraceae bacterium TWA4]|nr:D-alanyl-D-alanine carboxypeptidase [Lachnospiraceae bacterium TWA4]